MAAMKTVLALTTIFLIHQCLHFWGASTAQPGARNNGHLQFSNAQEVSIRKKNGNFNNVRICNGKIDQVLANVSEVLAVQCLRNNGGHVKPPPGDGFNYDISVEIPKPKSGGDWTDKNGGIRILLELFGRDPNVTVSDTATSTIVDVVNVSSGSTINALS